jgi:hypothetical protein
MHPSIHASITRQIKPTFPPTNQHTHTRTHRLCSLVHTPLMGLWERCMSASEAKEITLLSVLLAFVGLAMQLVVLASYMVEAYVLRREGGVALLGLVLLQHKGACVRACVSDRDSWQDVQSRSAPLRP